MVEIPSAANENSRRKSVRARRKSTGIAGAFRMVYFL